MSTCNKLIRVWRHPRKSYAECISVQYDSYRRGSVIVWLGICIDSRPERHVAKYTLTAQKYRNEILRPILRSFGGAFNAVFLLVQDNARAHPAIICMDFLDEEEIRFADKPFRSSDLNSIEYVWNVHYGRVSKPCNEFSQPNPGSFGKI